MTKVEARNPKSRKAMERMANPEVRTWKRYSNFNWTVQS